MTRASLEARVAATLILVALAAGCGIDGLRRTDSGGGVFPNGIEPPDTQVAVGPSHVVEIVNYARMRVIDKAHLGTFTDVDLHGVVGCPGLIADPRVQYDAASGRWFISLLQTDSPGPAAWCLAVSTDGNPSSFYHYEFDLPNNYYPDYQGLGIGDDKVVLTGDLATGSSDVPGGSAAVLVVRKSDVTAGVAQTASMPRRQYFAPDPAGSQYFPLQPAMALSPVPGAAVYVAGVDSEHAPTAALVRQFTGLPHASGSGVTVTSTMVGPLGSFAQAPAAQQKGTNVRVPSSHVLDNRIQSVVYRDGSLWLASQAACTPAGDTQARSCLRLVEIQPSGSSLPVNQDITFGTVGDDYFYPAITLDAQDDLVAVFNRSSANEYVSVYVSGRAPTDALGTLRQPPYLLKAGQVFYQGGAGRWGDYSGAAVDPSNPLLVWLGAEYPLPAANGVPQWGTWLGLVSKTFIPGNAAPTVTSISPASGPTTGGTAVIITGTGFQSGATVKIGGVVATGVVVASGTQITAVTPTHAVGAADVRVTNPNGQAGVLAAGFTYVVPGPRPVVTSVSPNSGSTSGNTDITVHGSGFTGLVADGVRFAGIPASTFCGPVTDTEIPCVLSPAHAAGAVHVTVTTAQGGTSLTTGSDLFSYVP